MTSKENILNKIREGRREKFPMPALDDLSTVQYDDRLAQFMEMVRLVGGDAVLLEQGQDVNELIRSLYPDASMIASSLPYITASVDPDTVNEAADLNGVDLGVVEGKVAVAENGCVWIPQTMKERAVLFISERLVIIVDRKDVVSNMHQAYDKIGISASRCSSPGYGCFISGPSKTADIAQALVMGAQAARRVTVLVV